MGCGSQGRSPSESQEGPSQNQATTSDHESVIRINPSSARSSPGKAPLSPTKSNFPPRRTMRSDPIPESVIVTQRTIRSPTGDGQGLASRHNVLRRKSPDVFMRVGRIACKRRWDRSGPQRTYYPRPRGAILPHRKLARTAIPVGFAGRRKARPDRAPGTGFRRVSDALLELLKHRYECPACNAI
jgi:hypothetical protein